MALQKEEQEGQKEFKEGTPQEVKTGDSAELLRQSAAKLQKFGEFKVIAAAIKGSDNLNPATKATRKIFLTDASRKADRETLKENLKIWLEALQSSDDLVAIVKSSQEKAESASKTLKKNLKKACEQTKDMEAAWRSLNLFFKNTGEDKLDNVTILNADMSQLNDLDNPLFIDAVSEELKENFDRLDLRNNYSMIVIPGYLGSKMVVDKWARLVDENKVMLITDYHNLEKTDSIVENFKRDDLSGGDEYLSHVIMSCNYLVGRGKDTDIGEEEDVYVPPSTSLAGKMYSATMSQVSAGKKFGSLNEVDGVRLPLKHTEISNLEKIGLVPMVNEFGKVMAYSSKTLFNGTNVGNQTYSVVRVFDFVLKKLMDFLNRHAFVNFDTDTQNMVRGEIRNFLDSIKGPKNLIEDYNIDQFEQDPNDPTRVLVKINLNPHFPAKNYVVSLDGKKGKGSDHFAFNTKVEQK